MELEMELNKINVKMSGDFGTPDFHKTLKEAYERDKIQNIKRDSDSFADSEKVSFLELRKNLEIKARVDVVNMDLTERMEESKRLLLKYPSGVVSHYLWFQPKELKNIDFFENEADESIMMIKVAFVEIYAGEAVMARVNILDMTLSEEYNVFETLSKKWRKCPKRVFRGEWPVNKRLTYFE
ncbi:hypothetical protein [Sphingobacterium kitahiroshimense]|uniref:hypothetical protein n=1 Tax=Sphingobacterium kitahiroshimense TaxID=470446 RepID=UPI00320798B6